MLDIGIFAPFGNDHKRNIAFCNDAEVGHIVLGSGDEVPAAAQLQAWVEQYRAGGVQVTALTPRRIRQAAFENEQERQVELDFMGPLLENMGAASIPFVHFYLNVDSLEDEADRPKLWQGLLDFYQQLIPLAEAAGVQISTHHYHVPDRLLWNYTTMSTLLNEVKSPSNGVTFCQGKSQMAGDDLAANILDYGEQIFMFHVRDIVTKIEGPSTPELEQRLADIGYLEVPFGAGEVDMVGSFKALKQIGYKGQIYPEHFPAIAGDQAAGLAWTIGYMKALDQAVEG